MGKVEIPLELVNAPQQRRSQKTLEKLLDAAEALIVEGGLEAVTVPAVVKRAGSSVGSFYARFPDKEALLGTLHKRACEQTIATADQVLDPERWRTASVEAIVAGLVEFAVRLFGSQRSVMAAFQRALASDPEFAARRATNGVELGKRAIVLLLPHAARFGHEEPLIAIPMALRFVTATLEQHNTMSSSGRAELAVSEETLVRELTRMALAYLDVASN